MVSGSAHGLMVPKNEIREYGVAGQTSTMIIQGKVVVALDETVTRRWRDTGSKVHMVGAKTSKKNSVMAVEIGSRGWCRGRYFVAGYSPTADPSPAGITAREELRENMSLILSKQDKYSNLILGGDLHAEVI